MKRFIFKNPQRCPHPTSPARRGVRRRPELLVGEGRLMSTIRMRRLRMSHRSAPPAAMAKPSAQRASAGLQARPSAGSAVNAGGHPGVGGYMEVGHSTAATSKPFTPVRATRCRLAAPAGGALLSTACRRSPPWHSRINRGHDGGLRRIARRRPRRSQRSMRRPGSGGGGQDFQHKMLRNMDLKSNYRWRILTRPNPGPGPARAALKRGAATCLPHHQSTSSALMP
jgi:hypothetical protein